LTSDSGGSAKSDAQKNCASVHIPYMPHDFYIPVMPYGDGICQNCYVYRCTVLPENRTKQEQISAGLRGAEV
jgi:hypothetical protein